MNILNMPRENSIVLHSCFCRKEKSYSLVIELIGKREKEPIFFICHLEGLARAIFCSGPKVFCMSCIIPRLIRKSIPEEQGNLNN